MEKIIINKWLPKKPYAGMAIGNRIFIREDAKITQELIAHELVHVKQYRTHGFIKFLSVWLWEFMTKGYWNIRWEVEAYERQSDEFFMEWAKNVLENNNIEYSK
mgnify:CR=1 FL=1